MEALNRRVRPVYRANRPVLRKLAIARATIAENSIPV
jgi:hypothetical protein